jgi:sulfite oxidase
MFSRGRLLLTTRNLNAVSRSLHTHHTRTGQKLRYVAVVGGCAASLLAIDYLKRQQTVHLAASKATPRPDHHLKVRQDLPTFDETVLNGHNNAQSGIWVSYGIGVYDITKFIPEHPGSDKIMLAAGNAIDPFWNIYQQHNNAEVLELLETYRIGNLKEEAGGGSGAKDMFDPWSAEPKRSPVLRPASQRPFNAEPPPEILGEWLSGHADKAKFR